MDFLFKVQSHNYNFLLLHDVSKHSMDIFFLCMIKYFVFLIPYTEDTELVDLCEQTHRKKIYMDFSSSGDLVRGGRAVVHSTAEHWSTFSSTLPSGPSWSSSCHVRMYVCMYVCMSAPSSAVFFQASHWPTDHMKSLFQSLFTNSAPLGRVGHRVAISICMYVCLRHLVHFFSKPLIGQQIT